MARITIDDLPPLEQLTEEQLTELFGAGRLSVRPMVEGLEDRFLPATLSALGALTAPPVTSTKTAVLPTTMQIINQAPTPAPKVILGTAIPGKTLDGGGVPGKSVDGGGVPGKTLDGGGVPGKTVDGGGVPGKSVEGGGVPGLSVEGGGVPGIRVQGGGVPGKSLDGGGVPG